MDADGTAVLFIGGRSGVGKTTVAHALHRLLTGGDVRHAVIEGDALDLAHPAPWEHGLTERNLAALWSNYRDLGYRRLIYTNTVAVLEARTLARAMGGDPAVVTVLLEAETATTDERLAQRETGESLAEHRRSSVRAAEHLARNAPSGTCRIRTDGRAPGDVAAEILDLLAWG